MMQPLLKAYLSSFAFALPFGFGATPFVEALGAKA
jgi:hypothetical protein